MTLTLKSFKRGRRDLPQGFTAAIIALASDAHVSDDLVFIQNGPCSCMSHWRLLEKAIPRQAPRSQSGAVIRVPRQDGGGTVELFDEHQAHEHVRQGQGTE